MKPPPTRYARAGELNIAYQVFGEGPLDLVFVPGFVSHLDLLWEEPTRAAVLRRWAAFARVLLFDKRNTGLSDRTHRSPTLEERMDDIRAVMDHAGIEQAAIMGYSEGGPLALLFAATYPERVSALVLAATFSKLQAPPEMEELLGLLEEYWGTGIALPIFYGSCDLEWAARFERSAVTPRGAAELLRMNVDMDVTAALPAISVPTLVIHRTGDPLVPIASAREMAAQIPSARLIELPGHTHAPDSDAEWAHETDLVEEFLTGASRTSTPDRVLATVLFTDIVSSTEQVTALGDQRWRQRLERHQAETHRALLQFHGREVKDTGDGVLATFDGPARAIRCAVALRDRAAETGVTIRAGLHAGEVELLEEDIAGIAVHLARRVQEHAEPGTVFVSQTVRDLVVGSGIEFSDRGAQELRGVEGSWRLFEVAAT